MRRCLAVAALVVAGCGGGDSAPPTGAATAQPSTDARPALCRDLRVRETGRVTDRSANELSGLVRSRTQRDLLWSHDDSGAGPVVYGLRSDGRVAATPAVPGAQAIDWEDIATGPAPNGGALLYIGDIGDNAASRPGIDVYRVREPKAGAPATAPAERLRLRYPDGAHDAEALLVDPVRGDLIVVTKGLDGGRAYSTPARLPAGSQATLRKGPRIRISLVTAGDVSADGRVVALRGYGRVAAWTRRGREPLSATLSRAPCTSPTSLASEGQGEAIALDRRGTSFLTVAEGSPAVLRRYAPAG